MKPWEWRVPRPHAAGAEFGERSNLTLSRLFGTVAASLTIQCHSSSAWILCTKWLSWLQFSPRQSWLWEGGGVWPLSWAIFICQRGYYYQRPSESIFLALLTYWKHLSCPSWASREIETKRRGYGKHLSTKSSRPVNLQVAGFSLWAMPQRLKYHFVSGVSFEPVHWRWSIVIWQHFFDRSVSSATQLSCSFSTIVVLLLLHPLSLCFFHQDLKGHFGRGPSCWLALHSLGFHVARKASYDSHQSSIWGQHAWDSVPLAPTSLK